MKAVEITFTSKSDKESVKREQRLECLQMIWFIIYNFLGAFYFGINIWEVFDKIDDKTIKNLKYFELFFSLSTMFMDIIMLF